MGDGFEGREREDLLLEAVGIVQIEAPSGGESGVFVGHVAHDVLLAQHIIA